MNNLFSLTYAPGIKRDGTNFQSKYCTDGQWIRFQVGRVKKIGGMQGVYTRVVGIGGLGYISSMLMIPFNEDVIVILGSTTGFYTYQLTQGWQYVRNSTFLFPGNVTPARTVQSILINNNLGGPQRLLWMVTSNLLNINDPSAPIFYIKQVDQLLALGAEVPVVLEGVDPRSNGGMLFVSDRLFLYGSGGYVQWSTTSGDLNFRLNNGGDPPLPTGAGFAILPTTEKIIYAASVRGGSTGTSILFWSLSSVIRATSIGNGDQLQLASDVISSSSSIISARAVVEYDGLFFWVGMDRFFVYNGIVGELPNTLNKNYFFDNVDMDQREKVFGVKNTKYGEIWWFYCDKRDNSEYPMRAIIYNKRENCWSDTLIPRVAGNFSDALGFMATVGIPLEDTDNNNYLWLHEIGSQQVRETGADAQRINPINSFFTTPTISWAAFPPGGNPEQPSRLLDRWLVLNRIEHDFVTDNNAPINISITAIIKEYAASDPTITPILAPDNDPIINTGLDHIVFNVQARNISFRFESVDNFEVGNIHFLFDIGYAQ